MRIEASSPLLPAVQRGKAITIHVDGKAIPAFEGETIAAVLLAEGIWTFRNSPKERQPRGIYCGMGICYDCLVTVDGIHAVRACVTPVSDGMQVNTCQELEL